jgi:hypothetical protein
MTAVSWFIAGLGIGALCVVTLQLTQNPTNPISAYLKSIPPIDTSTAVKEWH